jgi:hypothetical protein
MMKPFTVLSTLVLMLFFTSVVSAQLFTDDFESGTASPEWEVYKPQDACSEPGNICENITAVTMATAPDPLANGGDYIGWLQDLDGSYTGAALSIAGNITDQDYSIEADVYCYIPGATDPSAYTGVAFYADSNVSTYIKMVADFDGSQRIRLYNNIFDPVTFQYTFEHNFLAADIPGGIPTVDGWHKMKVEVKTLNADTTAFWCYFDGNELAGCPIYDTTDYRMSSGKYGVFSFQQDEDGIPGYYDNIVVNSLAGFNFPPVITSLPDTNATVFSLYQYQLIAEDNNGDTLTYSLTTAPYWLSIDSTNGLIEGAPGVYNVGDTVVTARVDDGRGGTDTQTYTLHVHPTVGIDSETQQFPQQYVLHQNHPNPFNPETQISYQIATGGYISLTIHDLLGREIKTLVSEDQPSGNYTVSWNGRDESGNIVPSGIYLYTLNAGNIVESKKMILMK